MRAGPATILLACATALFAVLGGCAFQAMEPVAADRSPPGSHRIYVIRHGGHTGLAVRAREVPEAAWPARRDFPDAEYLELGWGDREFYPRADPGAWLAIRTLFTPTPSTLRVFPVAGSLTRSFPDGEIIELQVSQAGFERMVEFVRQTYELDAFGRAIVIDSEVRDGSRFYASPRAFHASENCNVWVARALEAAGLAVRPETALTAGMLLRQVRRLRVASRAKRLRNGRCSVEGLRRMSGCSARYGPQVELRLASAGAIVPGADGGGVLRDWAFPPPAFPLLRSRH